MPKNRVKSLLLVVNDQCHPVNYIVAGVDVLCLRVKISPFPNTEAHPGGVHTRFFFGTGTTIVTLPVYCNLTSTAEVTFCHYRVDWGSSHLVCCTFIFVWVITQPQHSSRHFRLRRFFQQTVLYFAATARRCETKWRVPRCLSTGSDERPGSGAP